MSAMSIAVPQGLLARSAHSVEWADWLARLPKMITELLEDWSLRPDGDALHGACAYVLPVLTRHGETAVLKISYPHPEAEHEHLALRRWDGDVTVRLLRADPLRWAMLLERADPSRTLNDLDVRSACAVIAGLYRRLHVPAIPQLRRLSDQVAGWADRLRTLHDHPSVPRRLVDHAASLADTFASDPATDGTLLHSDLHFDNVLGADRPDQLWLVIDPKPLSGDPHFEVAPLLWNRWDEIVAAGNIRNALLERIYTVVDTAALDEDRVRDWIIVRELVNVLSALVDDGESPDSNEVTMAIVIAKAAQR
jgi:streptomycin 6-kinase